MSDEEAVLMRAAGERAADRIVVSAIQHDREKVLAVIAEELVRALVEIEVRRAFRKVGLPTP